MGIKLIRLFMKRIFMAFFAICILSNTYGQNRKKDQEVDIIDHQVQLGESVRLISKKYLVDPAEIYKLNKFAVEGINQGMVLKIPVPKKEVAVKEVVSVGNKDTASNQNDGVIQKQTTTEVVQENPIPTPNNDIRKIVITERKTEVNHKVVAKETLFSLAKDYNISVDEIKQNNIDELKNGLKIGQIIKIPKEKTVEIQQSTSATNEKSKVETVQSEKPQQVVGQDTSSETKSENTIHHKVEPKETLYSLSKVYNVSVDAIKQSNVDELKNGLKIGQTIKIPKEKSGVIQQSTNSTEENSKKQTVKVEKPKSVVVHDIAIDNNSANTIKHKVGPKETLYSLSKKYNVSVDNIKQQNEDLLKNGMQIGQILTIKTNP
jgi:LysM repeat protein